jgi:uncharacterized membrane protein
METKELGKWSFIAGIVLAIVAGLVPGAMLGTAADWIVPVLLVLGVVVGLINIQQKHVHDFLVATIALLATGAVPWVAIPLVGAYVGAVVAKIASFVAPAAVIVALKAIYEIGKK